MQAIYDAEALALSEEVLSLQGRIKELEAENTQLRHEVAIVECRDSKPSDLARIRELEKALHDEADAWEQTANFDLDTSWRPEECERRAANLRALAGKEESDD